MRLRAVQRVVLTLALLAGPGRGACWTRSCGRCRACSACAPASPGVDDGRRGEREPAPDLRAAFTRAMATGSIVAGRAGYGRAGSRAAIVASCPAAGDALASGSRCGPSRRQSHPANRRSANRRCRRNANCAASRVAPGASSRRSSRRVTTCCRLTTSRRRRTPVVAHRTSPNQHRPLPAVDRRRLATSAGPAPSKRLNGWKRCSLSLKAMTRYRGHFLNWYETRSLAVLEPAYVSSVDSGNLAGHLIALANACDEWHAPGAPVDAKSGMLDALGLASNFASRVDPIRAGGHDAGAADRRDRRFTRRAIVPRDPGADAPAPVAEGGAGGARHRSGGTARRNLGPRILAGNDRTAGAGRRPGQGQRHERSGPGRTDQSPRRDRAHDGAGHGFLVPYPARTSSLLSIGYSLADNGQDANCYDLLASEARLASLFAIAKGDVATRHWFRLGRSAVPIGGGSALISWSGSMFEYLMPSLVMRAPAGSLLEQTNRLVGGAAAGLRPVPWACHGVSLNRRTTPGTSSSPTSTPISAFPASGLKRGLSPRLRRSHPTPPASRPWWTPKGPRAELRRSGGHGRARAATASTRLLDFTSRPTSRGRPRSPSCADVHGASPGHDYRRDRQCASGVAGCGGGSTASR